MATDTPDAPASKRPRSWLLALLGIVVAVFVFMNLGGSTTREAPSSNPPRPQPRPGEKALDPAALDVRLEALTEEPPGPGGSERNPFGFRPKPPPPPPPPPRGQGSASPVHPSPPPPPTVPPIPLKFIGILEKEGIGRVALLTDCRSTFQHREGDTIAGQYRLVKIGVESVVVEYLNGKGRTTLRMSGQECVGK
jgi:hypothetical protein